MTTESIGSYLQQLRERAGTSYAMLAEQMKAKGFSVHQNTIRDIEAGKQVPKPGTLRAFAQTLRGADYQYMMELAGHLVAATGAPRLIRPDVEEIALRLDALPDAKRDKALPLIDQLIDLLWGEEPPEEGQ